MSLDIVDAHAHLGSWSHPAFAQVSADISTLVHEERLAGVRAVALTTSDRADNNALLNASLSCPLDLWLFLWASPSDPRLADLVGSRRATVRGLKVHASLEQVPLDDRRWDPIFELADATGLAVMVHTGRWQPASGFELALQRARTWPRLRFILSHAGGDTPELCLGAAREVRRGRLDNVAFDTAGLREHWALVRAMDLAGAERYMLGSDFPLAHPAMYIAQVLALRVPDQVKEGLLGANARRLLGEPSCPSTCIEPAGPPEVGASHGSLHDLLATPLVDEEAIAAGPLIDPSAVTREDAIAARPRNQPTTVLITGAGGPIGVNLTRSLHLSALPLQLIGTDADPYHRPLALTDACLALPRATEQGYLERINGIVADCDVDLILPTHPLEVRTLGLLRQKIKTRLFLPPQQAIETGQDKLRSHALFDAAGVPVPRTLAIEQPGDVERAFELLGPPPVWFRGSGVPGAGIGVASLPCRTPHVARAWVEHHEGYGRFMASEYLPGDNLTWLSVWREGVLWASQTRQRLAYVIPHVSPSGITGAPAVSRTVCRPRVREIGCQAVRAVCGEHSPHGVFFVDLKADAQGREQVTEINVGRFGTTLHFYTEAGFNFPELAVRLALDLLEDLPEPPVHDPLPEDTYWIRTLDCGPVLLSGRALDQR